MFLSLIENTVQPEPIYGIPQTGVRSTLFAALGQRLASNSFNRDKYIMGSLPFPFSCTR